MNIGLDYDGTVTSDPLLFRRFTLDAQRSGHNIYLVTMRYPSEVMDLLEGDPEWKLNLNAIVYTSRKAKRKFCQELGLKIDVWIDDEPRAIIMDADEAFGKPATPEGVVVTPGYPS